MKNKNILVSEDLLRRASEILGEPPERYLFISIPAQTLTLNTGNMIKKRFSVSTGAKGRGAENGSNRTPTGVFRIGGMIGEGAPAGRIFKGREDTGEDWDGVSLETNLILSRIIRLEGLEPGINRGGNVDTWNRYIYIHGTNREDAVGREPVSKGCICMKNQDVIDLYSEVTENSVVFIN